MSKRTGIEDTTTVLEIGTFNKLMSVKSSHSIPLLAKKKDGTMDVVMAGWRIMNVDPTNHDAFKKYVMSTPFDIQLSRARSSIKITKRDNLSDEHLNNLKQLMRDSGYFLDKNSTAEYVRATGERLGKHADAEFWFEDMREARVSRQAVIEETMAINAALIAMKADKETLRNALYIIGETPDKDDIESDLYYQLIVSLVDRQDEVKRKQFIQYYVDAKDSSDYIEAKIWFNKALKHDVITTHGGMFMFGSDHLGDNEEQCIKYIMSNADTRRFLIQAISNKTKFDEDVNAARKEFSVEIKSNDTGKVDHVRAIEYVKDQAKLTGLAQNPGPMFSSCKNLKEAVKKYNEKVDGANIPNAKHLTEEIVLEAISAGKE